MHKLNMFHGGSLSTQSLIGGYNPKGSSLRGKVVYGSGIYLTESFDQALNYSNSVKMVSLEIDTSKDLVNVNVSYDEVLKFIEENFTKKFFKEFKKEFDLKGLSTLNLERLEVYLINNYKRFHTKAKVLNEFFVQHGATHNLFRAGYINVRVFDTRIIRHVQKTDMYDSFIPDEVLNEMGLSK